MTTPPVVPANPVKPKLPISNASTEEGLSSDAAPPVGVGTAWLQYVAGGKTETGEGIKHVVHATPRSAVFINADDRLQYRLDRNEVVEPSAAIAEATDLLSQLKMCVSSAEIRERGMFVIGVALGRALERPQNESIDIHFEKARGFVTARRREKLQMVNLVTTGSAGLVCAIVTTLVHLISTGWAPFLLGIALGSAGAVASVLLRFKSVTIDAYTTPIFVAAAGIARAAFGAVAGVVFILMQRSELILAFTGVSTDLIALGCFLAGFSERLLPDLLEKLEHAATNSRTEP